MFGTLVFIMPPGWAFIILFFHAASVNNSDGFVFIIRRSVYSTLNQSLIIFPRGFTPKERRLSLFLRFAILTFHSTLTFYLQLRFYFSITNLSFLLRSTFQSPSITIFFYFSLLFFFSFYFLINTVHTHLLTASCSILSIFFFILLCHVRSATFLFHLPFRLSLLPYYSSLQITTLYCSILDFSFFTSFFYSNPFNQSLS